VRIPALLALALALVALVTLPARAAPLGQWVWTRADREPLAAARAVRPDVTAAVSVAELRFERGQVVSALRLSPRTVAGVTAITVRLHDSFHAAFSLDDAQLADVTEGALRRVLALSPPSGPAELQLDYDCPVERLPRYAALLHALHVRGVFTGRSVWITSLVAQLRAPAYGALFRGLVAGHVLQLFDTGERAEADAGEALRRLTDRAGLPFALGLGAFERGLGAARRTDHEAFWALAPELAKSALYRGSWVFPAGLPWSERVGGLP
jgi:hypothetical protein